MTAAMAALAVCMGLYVPVVPAQFSRAPYLQWVEPDAITIMWQTRSPAPTIIEYGQGALEHRLVDLQPKRDHEVRLTGLLPNRWYKYRVRAGSAKFDGMFHTAPAGPRPFRMVVWGDNRTLPERHARIAELMARWHPDIAVNVGDVVTHGRVLEEWDREFFKPATPLIWRVPFYVAIGNHEGNAKWFYKFFCFPKPENYYAVTYAHARLVILDTNQDLRPSSPQGKWLRRELQSPAFKRAWWRFTFYHHPAWTETGHGHDGALQYIVPLQEKAGVDVSFSGHVHDYERGRHGGTVYIITGGGGAPLVPARRNDLPEVEVWQSRLHFCVVDVGLKTCRIRAVDINGAIFDEVVITKRR